MRIKNTLHILLYFILAFLTISLTSCKKNGDSSSTPPLALTGVATGVGHKWATLNAMIKAYNNNVTLTFDYDTSAALTHTIAANPGTLGGNVSTYISASLTGLIPGQEYHYRVKAVSSTETIYGNDTTFTTTNPGKTIVTFNPDLIYGTLTDVDNNVYKTIPIGTQTWMAENLATTKYNDGTAIPFITDETVWADSSYAAYSWYNNDSIVYGGIYNWEAVKSGKLCPAGWHVPTDDDWTTLTAFLNGDSIAGGILMEAGNVHWQTPNRSLTNETGFTALPGGYRNYLGTYVNIKRYGYWWSSTESSSSNAYCRLIYYSFKYMARTNSTKKSGLSVRCAMD